MAKSGNMTAFILVPLLLLGCTPDPSTTEAGNSNQAVEDDPGPKIDWQSAADGSKYFIEDDENRALARRCWKINDGYDCLNAQSIKGNERYTELFRFKQDNLSVYRYDYAGSNSLGYRCTLSDGKILSEHVSTSRGVSLTNVHNLEISLSGGPLTREAVKKALGSKPAKNETSYFDCPMIASAVAIDGPAAITVDTIRYKDVMF